MTLTRFNLRLQPDMHFETQIYKGMLFFISLVSLFHQRGKKAHLIAIVNQRIINVHKEAYFIVSDMQNSDLTRYKCEFFFLVEAP
jgi:hypothetical protein